MISAQCPNCQAKIRCNDRFAGQVVACPGCKQKFQVPAKPPALPADSQPTPLSPVLAESPRQKTAASAGRNSNPSVIKKNLVPYLIAGGVLVLVVGVLIVSLALNSHSTPPDISQRPSSNEQPPAAKSDTPKPEQQTPPAAPKKEVEADPAKSFTEFVTNVENKANGFTKVDYDNNPKSKGWNKWRFKLCDLGYDVKKTDSLVCPIEGVIEFNLQIDKSPTFETQQAAEAFSFPATEMREENPQPYQVRYAWQKERWMLTTILTKNYDLNKYRAKLDAILNMKPIPTGSMYTGPFVKVDRNPTGVWKFLFNTIE